MGFPKLELMIAEESRTPDLEARLKTYLDSLGVESVSLGVISEASTGIPRGPVFVELAEGSDAGEMAEKIKAQEFEGHRIGVTVVPPKKEDDVKPETAESQVEPIDEGSHLPRA